MAFTLKPLPYPNDALAPHISARTMEIHHDKHHQKYVDTLNKLVEGSDYEKMSLEDIIRKSAAEKAGKAQKIFNNAAQAWNHDLFWRSMAPDGGKPSAAMAKRIDKSFGDLAGFKRDFKKAATEQFGSGWAWLVASGDGLEIVTTGNAKNPLTENKKPLLTCDVWEHAYYLDYQNKRDEFVVAFLDKLVNWKFVEQQI